MKSLLVVALLVPAVTYAFPNESTGFRGIEWETPFEQVATQFAPLFEDKGGARFYQRKDDKLNIGEAALEYIHYVFYKGRFQGVLIRTADGVANQRALRDAMSAQFGAGAQPNRYMEQFYWYGAITSISLDCFGAQRRCTAYIRSKALEDLQRADRKAAASEAKKDF